MDPEQKKTRTIEAGELLKATLRDAVVVLATVSNAGSARCFGAVADIVDIVIIDEAGRLRDDSFFPIVAAEMKECKGSTLVGDPKQLNGFTADTPADKIALVVNWPYNSECETWKGRACHQGHWAKAM